MRIRQDWIASRRELYSHTRQYVERILGRDSADLRAYRQEFEKEFCCRWSPVLPEVFLQELSKARLVLFGDFHPLPQSQKAVLRLLRNLQPLLSEATLRRPLVLALECVDAKYQKAVDDFLEGKLSEADFLLACEWEKNWGFPWGNYRSLFTFARKHNISILALNETKSQRTAKSLQARDELAADLLQHLLYAEPEALVLVVYGDMHLAQDHIPFYLRQVPELRAVEALKIVFQNPEELFFSVLESGQDLNLVRLETGAYALLSVPPWVQWQNYQMYLETSFDVALIDSDFGDDDDDDEFSEVLDYTDHVARYVKFIANEIGVPVDTSELAVYSVGADLLDERLDEVVIDKTWVDRVRRLMAEGFSFYIPEMKMAYLAKPTVNHASFLAMQYIHWVLGGYRNFAANMPESFESWIWQKSIGYWGMKIVNHRVKADTLLDIKKAFWARSESKEREVLRLTLAQKMREFRMTAGLPVGELPAVNDAMTYYYAGELLSGILGEKIYGAFQKKVFLEGMGMQLLTENSSESSFGIVYLEFLKKLDSVPLPFQSKNEKF